MSKKTGQKARVSRRFGGYYYVLDHKNAEVPCRLKGSLKKLGRSTNLVVVGDHVEFIYTDENRTEGWITSVAERKTELRRAKGFHHKRGGKDSRPGQTLISNLDLVFVVLPVREPDFHPLLLDRFLVMVEHMKIEPVILLQKWDLVGEREEELLSYKSLYESIGYKVHCLSLLTGEGLDRFKKDLVGKTCFLMGPSGAGKSSMVKELNPGLGIRIGEWSERCKTGPQTTTSTCIYPLYEESYLADTAGFSQVFLHHIPREDLRFYFLDFEPFEHCEFSDCLHEGEDGCEIIKAVQEGKVNSGRYDRYRKILEECDQG